MPIALIIPLLLALGLGVAAAASQSKKITAPLPSGLKVIAEGEESGAGVVARWHVLSFDGNDSPPFIGAISTERTGFAPGPFVRQVQDDDLGEAIKAIVRNALEIVASVELDLGGDGTGIDLDAGNLPLPPPAPAPTLPPPLPPPALPPPAPTPGESDEDQLGAATRTLLEKLASLDIDKTLRSKLRSLGIPKGMEHLLAHPFVYPVIAEEIPCEPGQAWAVVGPSGVIARDPLRCVDRNSRAHPSHPWNQPGWEGSPPKEAEPGPDADDDYLPADQISAGDACGAGRGLDGGFPFDLDGSLFDGMYCDGGKWSNVTLNGDAPAWADGQVHKTRGTLLSVIATKLNDGTTKWLRYKYGEPCGPKNRKLGKQVVKFWFKNSAGMSGFEIAAKVCRASKVAHGVALGQPTWGKIKDCGKQRRRCIFKPIPTNIWDCYMASKPRCK